MKSAVAITVEGIIMKPVSSAPMTAGLLLYHGLSSVATVILLTDYVSDGVLDNWLLLNGLTSHAQVVYQGQSRVVQVNKLRQQGYALELIFEPDPTVVAALVREGYSCSHFIHAQYAVPSWRPDYEGSRRPWNEIAEQVAHQAYLRAKDGRLSSVDD